MIFIMKVRVSPWRLLSMLLILIILGAGIIFGFTFNFFLHPIKDWGWQPWVILGIWFGTSVLLIVLTLTTSYYEINKRYVIVHKGRQKLCYNYSDVVYIDEEQSLKKKTVTFYTRQGHARYLIFDRKGLLYKVMIANCTNRLTKEEFHQKYPKVKL